MNRPLTIGAILFFAALTASTAKDSHPPRPNILFILADDLGWHDPGFQGHPFFQTPNLDRLAGEGMRFTQAYAPAPICSASRAGFLTGKTPARLGFEFVTKDKAAFQPMKTPLRAPRYTLDLPLEEITIAEVLAETGYETAFFGKWHVSRHHGGYLGWSPTHGPKNQGFQTAAEDFGSHPYSYWKDRKARTFLDRSEGDFPADTMTGHAIDFVKGGHRAPFFLMVSHFFVHTPVHTRLKWLHDRCLAAIPADHPRRADLAHYAAMVATLDYHVGQLLDALDESGLAGSTVVVLTSDNGGHPEYGGNAPLRGGKWNLYEGGIRVPLVVRWPGHVAAGSVGETPVTGCDLFPTFAGLAGATSPPADLDGADLGPLLRGDTAPMPERDLLWHFPYYHPETNFDEAPATIGIDDGLTSQTRPQSALRSGDWKLIHFHESERDELYNLATDPAEQHDLAATATERTATLRKKLDAALDASGARLPERGSGRRILPRTQ